MEFEFDEFLDDSSMEEIDYPEEEEEEDPLEFVPAVVDGVIHDGVILQPADHWVATNMVHQEQHACCICLEELQPGRFRSAACGDDNHRACDTCLKRHFTNWANHPISVNIPYPACPAEGCLAPFPQTLFASVGLNATEVKQLDRWITECENRANPRVACPTCSKSISVPSGTLADRSPGTLGITCGNHAFCFHCLEPVPLGLARQSQSSLVEACHACLAHPRMPRPGKFNRFFKRRTPAKAGEFVLLRNFQLRVEDVARQIEDMCAGETMAVPCMKCGAALHRATACNELCHCGMVRCDVCGVSGLDYDSHLIDHWGAHGMNGYCPRWSNDEFWRHTIVCREDKRCTEGVCYSDKHDCTRPEHKDFRESVVGVRRLRRLNYAMLSLPPPVRQSVAERVMTGHGEGAKWLQRLSLACRHGQLV